MMNHYSCSCRDRNYSGFTLLEMAFVLLVMGIVVSMLIPTVSGVHNKSMVEEDRKILSDLKEVIMGQFLATGKLPVCRDVSGNSVDSSSNPIQGNCDTAKSLGDLGVRIIDSRNNPIKYDVSNVHFDITPLPPLTPPVPADVLGGLTGTDLTNVCDALRNAIPTAANPKPLPLLAYPAEVPPATCSTIPDYDPPVPPGVPNWTTYCQPANNVDVAFVLVATGINRDGNNGEVVTSTNAVLGNRNAIIPPTLHDRVFENVGRRHNEKWSYDDLMEIVTFQQLRAAINKSCP